MKWWVKGLIATVVWFVLVFVGFQVFFSGPTTPDEDARLSEMMGMVIGAGIGPIWAVTWYLDRQKKPQKG